MASRIGNGDRVIGMAVSASGKLTKKVYAHEHLSPIYSFSRFLGENDEAAAGTTLVMVIVDQSDRAVIIGAAVIGECEGRPVVDQCQWGDMPTRLTVLMADALERFVSERRQSADEAEMKSATCELVNDELAAALRS